MILQGIFNEIKEPFLQLNRLPLIFTTFYCLHSTEFTLKLDNISNQIEKIYQEKFRVSLSINIFFRERKCMGYINICWLQPTFISVYGPNGPKCACFNIITGNKNFYYLLQVYKSLYIEPL